MSLDYSTRYFQLTSDILIEYNYATEGGTDCKIEVSELGKNSIISSSTPYMKYYLINQETNGINLNTGNFVVPTNKSQTSFVKLQHRVGGRNVFSAPTDTLLPFTASTTGTISTAGTQ